MNRPPFDPNLLAQRAALIGSTPQAPQATVQANIITQDNIEKAMHEASASLAQVEAELERTLARLTDVRAACRSTVEHNQGNQIVQVNGESMSMADMAKRFRFARPNDLDSVETQMRFIKSIVDLLLAGPTAP